MSTTPRGTAPVAYFWGEDAYAIDRAVAAFRLAAAGSGEPLEMWRAPSDDEDAASGNTA